ncbi:MAG: Cell division protein FtsK/SpoIIIE [Desulfotomaculum sp. 46_296]|nr:MAG: Cell division protein FtsK/SpoIIIE [Desulfotomaculum sp. 46_296]HAU30774.1 cell division protein FtsK [Desulfotomaculum sp.]
MAISRQAKEQQKYEIVGIVFLTVAILCLISLLNPSVGLVSKLVERILRGITGEGRYVFPVLLVFFGLRLLFLKSQLKVIPRFYGGLLIFIVILTVIHLIIPPSHALDAGLKGKGGGIVGAVCSLVLKRSFGLTGTYVVLFTLALVGILLSANVSLNMLIKRSVIRFSILYARFKQFFLNFLFTEEEIEIPDDPPSPPVIIDQSGIEAEEFAEGEIAGGKKGNKPAFAKDVRAPVITFHTENRDQYGEEDLPAVFLPGELEPLATTENISYQLPTLSILARQVRPKVRRVSKDITESIRTLEETLQSFGVKARVTQVSRGPTITRYEIQPPAGVKVSRIVSLSDDIALCMAAPDVRIEAPIPGKAAVGIEVPNREISMVSLRELLETDEFQKSASCLTVALGKDIAGKPIVADLAQMPHLLIAGATGSGKSVCLNILIASILFKAPPDKVKFLIIDPKMVELSTYDGIPHLVSPVVTEPRKAATSLRWAVKEMERRYELFASAGVRDINRYNNLPYSFESRDGQEEERKTIPFLVVIIDELADLMMIAPADVEDAICRLAQMARAAGIHLVVATQRPSVDVITGMIKANIPSRISFAVSSQIDSRTILDMAGAEKLLGRGDMLFYPVGAAKPVRLQGAFLSDQEVESLVSFLKKQACPNYEGRLIGETNSRGNSQEFEDELLPRAVEFLIEAGHGSVSLLQRRLRIGYTRAARLIDIMERRGIVGGSEGGNKPRAVLMTLDQYQETFHRQ